MNRRLLVVFGLVLLVTAITSENPFHPDEHFQIVELASFKMGLTPRAYLPWEYGAGLRPWLLPLVAFACMKVLRALLGADVFAATMFLRGLAAALSLVSILRLLRYTAGREAKATWRAQAFFVLTAGFVPYLSVRFSSEGLSASLFTIAFTMLEDGRGERPWRRELAAGLLFAAAFQCRYQTILMLGGYAAWRLFFQRPPLARWVLPLVGLALGNVLALGIDAWGYGRLVFPFYTYVHVNVVEGVAAKFSTEPFYAYAYLPLANVFVIPAFAALVSSVVFWIRRPRDPFTWIMAPTVLGFSLLGHKEERFLFPLGIFAAFTVAPAFAGLRVFAWRRALPVRVLWGVNLAIMLVMAVYPLHWRDRVPLARTMTRTLRDTDVVYMDRAASTFFPAFRGRYAERELTSDCAVPAGAYVLTSGEGAPLPGAELVYSEWPFGGHARGLRVWMQDALDGARRRFGPVVQPVAWYGLYRVSTARPASGEGAPRDCPERAFHPIATQRP